MKVFIVVSEYSDLAKQSNEYCDCFLDGIDAYKYALRLSNEDNFRTFHVIEKDFNDK